MSRPTITIAPNAELQQELKRKIKENKDRKRADRLRIILYKIEGYSNKHIANLLQIGRKQVTKILQRYRQGGIEAVLKPDKYQGSQAKLSPEQQQALIIELRTNIYPTAMQVIAWVAGQWQINYDLSGMHKLLKRLGFSYKKNRLVPSKADPELQKKFVHWLDGLRAQMEADELLMYGDAVHFKHNAEAGYGWSLKGSPHHIPSNTGRQRYNVLGAYDPQNHEYYFMLTADNINQDKMIAFLDGLRQKFPDKKQLYLILDNASYNHALRVKAEAKRQTVILAYLPPYSPNLNPIERLWKFVRKKFFKDKYRDTFAKFCTQLDEFFANLDQYQDELTSLLTENFQLIPETWQSSA